MVVHVAIAIAWTYPLATMGATHTALPRVASEGLARNDQAYSISAASRNAAALASGDLARLLDWRLCHPTPRAATLGEHAIELGVLAVPGWLATGDPVVAYNVACLLLVVVAGASTFALVRHWTGSALAGLVGGLAFAFHPRQIDDLVHPFVMGIHWIPLVLLALERVLETGRARWVAVLALAGTLQALVGSYPLLAAATFGGVYGAMRLWQRRDLLDAGRVLRLALALGVVAVAAGSVLVHYAGVDAWGVERRRQMLVPFGNLLPGGPHAVGALALALGAVALVRNGARPSPAWPVLAGGLACVLLAGGGRLWPAGPPVAFYPWLASHVWILGIVRVPAAIRTGAHLAVALLAALGAARLLAGLERRPRARVVLGLVLPALLLVEYFHPAVSRAVYGTPRAVALVPRRPGYAVLAAYRAFEEHGLGGPIAEIPFDHDGRGQVFRMPFYSLLAAYHGRPVAACFTSHVPPSYHEVSRIVAGADADPERVVVELAAAGFRNLVIHHGADLDLLGRLANVPGVETLRHASHVTALRIARPVAPHHDAARLALAAVVPARFEFKGYRRPVLEVAIRNASPRPWALPHPVRPLAVRWRWTHAGGAPASPWHEGVTMLPLALAAGATAAVRVGVDPPPGGCPDCRPEVRVPELGWRASGGA